MNFAIGGNVTGMILGIVNNEVEYMEQCFNSSLTTASFEGFECTLNKVSCRFINQLNDSELVKVRMQLCIINRKS